jgi:hypothetical protein
MPDDKMDARCKMPDDKMDAGHKFDEVKEFQ